MDGATSGIDDWMTGKLGEEFNARLARVALKLTATGVDEFGLDPQWTKYALASVAFLHRKYFRTEIFGKEHVPAGRVLLISNHSGQVPIDAALIGASLFMDVEPPRFTRAMVEKWTQTLPFISLLFARVGQVVGVPENAKRLLESDEALLVFPEGARGISKSFDKRYNLVDFGLGTPVALEDARPGDFVQAWTSDEVQGHSMIFLGWDRDDAGSITGIRYWSSQPWTDGIGESEMAVRATPDAFDPGRIHIARAACPR